MKQIQAAFVAEYLKLKRSKIIAITIGLFIFIPLMMSLMMFLAKFPELASKFGLVGTKASMLRIGNADWRNYLTLITQVVAGVGVIFYGFITSWVFGREYAEHTLKDIIVMPVSRSNIVIAKFMIVVIWCILISMVFYSSVLAAGALINLSGFSSGLFLQNFTQFSITVLLTILLCSPVALLASYSRGYMLPIGFVILTMIMANFTGLVGLGPYFPWAIPGLSIASEANGIHLMPVSYVILFATSILGVLGTIAFWRFADQR